MLIISTQIAVKGERDEAKLTKVDYIEHFGGPILGYACKQLSVCAGRYASHRRKMGTVVLHELDARLLLFPQLEVAVDGGRDQEVCSVDGWISVYRTPCEWERTAYFVTTQKLIVSRCIKLL